MPYLSSRSSYCVGQAMMRDTAIPLAARQEVIRLALQEGDRERALELRGDLYRELLELIAHSEQQDCDATDGDFIESCNGGWAESIEEFLKTDQLGFE